MVITPNDFPSYFDWNNQKHPLVPKVTSVPKPTKEQLEAVVFDDEGLRDGLQGTSLYPGVRDAHRYIDIAHELGIRALTVGIFAEVGSRAEQVTLSCLKYLDKNYPDITPILVVRPLPPDLQYYLTCMEINPRVEALIFQGSSSPRLWVQGWTHAQVLENLASAIDFVESHNPGKALSTLEDATRTTPEFLMEFLKMSVQHNAKRVIFADTTGHVDMWGAYRFTRFIRESLDAMGKRGESVEIDFHGHRDRNLDIPVALAAISGGATRIHGVVLGIGERAGNAVLDALIYNVARLIEEAGGVHPYNLSKLAGLCRQYAVMTNSVIPAHYPLIGANAFMTAVGIHADAQEKGMKLLNSLINAEIPYSKDELAEIEKILRTIYTSVDHHELGRIQRYVIGPLSGEATVRMWLYSQGYPLESMDNVAIISKIKRYAKQQNRTLRDEEIFEILEQKGITRTRKVQL